MGILNDFLNKAILAHIDFNTVLILFRKLEFFLMSRPTGKKPSVAASSSCRATRSSAVKAGPTPVDV